MKVSPYNKGMHLKEDQLMPLDSTCPFCRSTDRIPVGPLQEGPEVILLTCRTCYASSASRIPTSEALSEYYQDYHDIPYSTHGKKITFDSPDKLANHIYEKAAHGRNRSCMNILDFGGGDGSISVSIAERFLRDGGSKVNIVVIDYDYTIARHDDGRICLSHRSTLADLNNEKYDLVVASASIEHVPKPRKILIKLLKSMRAGGVFYARTPYMVPFFKLFAALGLRLDLTYPAHIHDLGGSFWNTIFNKLSPDTSFEILASKPSIVETSFKDHFFRTLAAYVFKAPWYLLRNHYTLVGGWEVFAMKK